MKTLYKITFMALFLSATSCNKLDDFIGGGGDGDPDPTPNTNVNFQPIQSINIGGEGSAEISAFDPETNKIFVVNNDEDLGLGEISVYDISDVNTPVKLTSIDVSSIGAPNSVSVSNGLIAIAV